jgi:serine O-acetyltransferase
MTDGGKDEMAIGDIDALRPAAVPKPNVSAPEGLRNLVSGDVAALGTGPKGPLFFLAAALGLNKFSAILLYRLSARFGGGARLLRPLSSIAQRMNAILNACEISPEARIGPGLHLPHPSGIVLGSITAGAGLTIMQNVTMGLRDRRADHEDLSNYPRLGADVSIGPGAVVLGPIQIGDGAKVGANAVVLTDIPDRGVAIGNPAKILPGKDD